MRVGSANKECIDVSRPRKSSAVTKSAEFHGGTEGSVNAKPPGIHIHMPYTAITQREEMPAVA